MGNQLLILSGMEWKANVTFKAQDSDATGKVTDICATHWTGGLTQKYRIYRRGDAWIREQWWEFIISSILQKCTSRNSTGPSHSPHTLCRNKV